MFGNDVALAGMLGMRRAVLHTWDVAVALDPATEIAAEVVVLLIYTVSGTAGRVGKSAQNTHEIVVKTVAPERSLVLMTGPRSPLSLVLAPHRSSCGYCETVEPVGGKRRCLCSD
jgi:hypothetical protein